MMQSGCTRFLYANLNYYQQITEDRTSQRHTYFHQMQELYCVAVFSSVEILRSHEKVALA